jgi:hypothetical protein
MNNEFVEVHNEPQSVLRARMHRKQQQCKFEILQILYSVMIYVNDVQRMQTVSYNGSYAPYFKFRIQ